MQQSEDTDISQRRGAKPKQGSICLIVTVTETPVYIMMCGYNSYL